MFALWQSVYLSGILMPFLAARTVLYSFMLSYFFFFFCKSPSCTLWWHHEHNQRLQIPTRYGRLEKSLQSRAVLLVIQIKMVHRHNFIKGPFHTTEKHQFDIILLDIIKLTWIFYLMQTLVSLFRFYVWQVIFISLCSKDQAEQFLGNQ